MINLVLKIKTYKEVNFAKTIQLDKTILKRINK